jgi:uncharacterized membrane protein HdeD (DUF308 family)
VSLLCGVAAVVIGVLAYGVALTTALVWTASIGTLAIMAGLVVIGSTLVPTRTTFSAGSRIWQNDGLP